MSVLLTLVVVWKIHERGVCGCRETGEDPKSHASRASRASSDTPAFVMCSSLCELSLPFHTVSVSSFPAAWDDRGYLRSFVEGEACLATSQGPELCGHRWRLGLEAEQHPLGRAAQSCPACPGPRASIFAVCLQCSLHHLMSGAWAKP